MWLLFYGIIAYISFDFLLFNDNQIYVRTKKQQLKGESTKAPTITKNRWYFDFDA